MMIYTQSPFVPAARFTSRLNRHDDGDYSITLTTAKGDQLLHLCGIAPEDLQALATNIEEALCCHA